MQIAEFYLRDRAFAATLAKMPLRFPLVELPEFGRLSAMASISALNVESNVLGDSWKHLHDPMADIGLLSESISSLAGFNTISDSMKQLHDPMAGIGFT